MEKVDILIVDDDSVSLKIISRIFELEGISHCTANNAHDALHLYGEHTIRLILTDLKLPEMDGLELIRAIREKDRAIPIIAFSAFAFEEDIKKALDSGATDSLSKPAEYEDIVAKVRQYLD